MKVFIQYKVVETKEIANIIDIEAHKKTFLNREAGFKIIFMDNTEMTFSQKIPYESYPSDISAIKNKWRLMMDKVIEKWQSDKTEIEIIN